MIYRRGDNMNDNELENDFTEYTEQFDEAENQTIDAQEIEDNKQAFIEEFNDFEKDTALKILEILDEKKHMLNVEVYGLTAIVKSLILEYGDPLMIDGVIEYLKYHTAQE